MYYIFHCREQKKYRNEQTLERVESNIDLFLDSARINCGCCCLWWYFFEPFCLPATSHLVLYWIFSFFYQIVPVKFEKWLRFNFSLSLFSSSKSILKYRFEIEFCSVFLRNVIWNVYSVRSSLGILSQKMPKK